MKQFIADKIRNEKGNAKLHSTLFAGTFLLFTFYFLLATPIEVSAARLFFETNSTEVGVGQEMEVTLYLDSEGDTVNALEGTVNIPTLLAFGTVRDGESLISLWGERPEISNQRIVFGGLIPGGWHGVRGKIFSFVVRTKDSGVGSVSLIDPMVLLHDGKGTEVMVSTEKLTLQADKSIPLIPFSIDVSDVESPEPFTPLLGTDPDIFEGDYFLVFISQDKRSGIDRYEAQESKSLLKDEKGGNWNVVESPYRIIDQSLKSFVYIRAIDRANNVRVSLFEPTEIPSKKINVIIPVGLIILLLVIIIVLVYRRHKNKYE